MRGDDGVGEPGGHGEVGDGTDEQGYGEEVVEDFLAVARPEAKDVVGELLVWWLARYSAVERGDRVGERRRG